MRAQQDSVALDWIKGEIKETLLQAQQALDVVAESPDDAISMRECLTALHQVHGTLKMVELPGAVQFASEMEELAQALMNDNIPDKGNAQEMLMQGILQLPGYLDLVQKEHTDAIGFIHRVVSDLRIARGEQPLPEPEGVVEHKPDFELINATPGKAAIDNFGTTGGEVAVRKLRQRYQRSLLELLKGQNRRDNLALLTKAFSMLAKITAGSPVNHLSQLTITVLEALSNDSVKLDAKLGSLLKHIDPVLKNLIENGSQGLSTPVPEVLLNGLMQIVLNDATQTPRVQAIKKKYLVKTDSERPESEPVILGPDRDTMSVVAKVLLEELIILKDKLDLYVRATTKKADELQALVPSLEQLADSMSVIGIDRVQGIIREQLEHLKAALNDSGEPPEDLLIDMASAFIEVEGIISPMVLPDGSEMQSEAIGDLSDAQESVVTEIRNGLSQCKDSVIEFISADWDRTKIENVPRKLTDLRGSLSIINQDRPARVLLACASYLSKSVLQTSTHPTLEQMDYLADALTSIDYFFEKFLDSSAEPYIQMLEVAEASIAKLGFPAESIDADYEEDRKQKVEEEAEQADDVEIGQVTQEPEESAPDDQLVTTAEEDQESLAAEPAVLTDESEEPIATAEDITEPIPPQEIPDAVEKPEPVEARDVQEPVVDSPIPEDVEQELPKTEPVEEEESLRSVEPDADDTETEAVELESVTTPTGTPAREESQDISNADISVDDSAVAADEPEQAVEEIVTEDVFRGSELADEGTIELPEEALDVEDSEAEPESPGQIAESEFEIEEVDYDTESVREVINEQEAVETEPEAPEAEVEEDSIIDEEIIEIFVEEAAEVLETINEYYPVWRVNSADQEALTSIRRAFHTLKGSGRMVGATVVGELAWAVENMLNKVLEQSIGVGPELLRLMDQVLERVPVAIKAFEEKKQHSVDVSDLQEIAHRVARGESAPSAPAPAPEPESAPADAMEESPAEEMIIEEIFDDSELPEAEEDDLVSLEQEELDSELLEIFESEAATHLMTLREFVERAERGPVSFTPEVRAALHTLKGSASMAEITSITTLAVPLDRFTSKLFDRHIKTNPRITALLRQAIDLVSDVLLNLVEMAKLELEGTRDFLNELEVLRKEFIGDEEVETTEKPAEMPVFSFEGIDALLDSEEILETWEADGLSRLVAELDLVTERAGSSARKGLHELASNLRLSYGPLSISRPPSDVVMATLNRAHNHLIEMLDEVAAGQIESVNESILASLANLSDLDEEDLSSSEPIHFVQEAWTLLNNIDSTVQFWKEDIYNSLELEKLYGYFNTLSGLAEEIDERVMVELCERVIALCAALKNGDLAAEDSDPGLLDSCHHQLVDFLGVIQRSEELLPNELLIRELEQRIELEIIPQKVERTAQEEPKVETRPVEEKQSTSEAEETVHEEVDQEILSIFLEEAEELTESIDQSILQWNSQKGDPVPLKNLLRYLHTFKGGARLAGLSSLGEYAHNFETYLIDAQQGKIEINDVLFAELNKRQDEINRRVEIYQRMVSGEATDAERASVARSPSEDAGETVEVETTAESLPAEQEQEQEQSHGKTAVPQEVVRVSAELLDELLGMASEASITRGLIEQQINDFGEAIDELELTAARVRDQVRRLEIETESRETVYKAKVQEGNSEFDELEMDQYTHLQEISRSLAEGVSDMLDLKETLKNKSRDTELLLQQQARLGNELQEGLTRTKMVPFSRTIPRLRRIVRQVSDELGKKIRFDAFNVEGELDRNVLEKIVAPLEHMLRNAVDHGIESAEARREANKPQEGRITLRLYRESGYFVLQVSDDGGGIDVNKVRKKAIEKGLMSPDARMSNQEIMSFIMKAGFSTATQLTQISGRGVGLDVVDSEIRQLGGDVTIESVLGKGTEFIIRIPFTVAITRALMVVVADEVYAIPLNSIEGIVRVSPYELEAYYQPDAPRFEYAGQTYKLVYMGNALENTGNPDLQGQVSLLSVILARSGENAVAFQVDRVIGSREVVVKSLGPQFNEVTGVSGASILGDGSVVVILDLMALVRACSETNVELEIVEEPEFEEVERVRTVMIVDDSVTVRKVTSRLIERQGWDVMLAKDGIDALEQLQDKLPDVMLLDIEMPRMDGFEVLRSVRRDDMMKDLPIIMITSRTGEKHKTQASELGVNRYLGKPFQESMLLDTIEEVISERRG